jgi:hypothetical protein
MTTNHGFMPAPPPPDRYAESKLKNAHTNMNAAEITAKMIQDAGFLDPSQVDAAPDDGPRGMRTRQARAAQKRVATSYSHRKLPTSQDVYGAYYHPSIHNGGMNE